MAEPALPAPRTRMQHAAVGVLAAGSQPEFQPGRSAADSGECVFPCQPVPTKQHACPNRPPDGERFVHLGTRGHVQRAWHAMTRVLEGMPVQHLLPAGEEEHNIQLGTVA